MMPMKKASSEMKRAERPIKQMTRLSALAIGLRLMMTAAPKTSMRKAKSQKRIGLIGRLQIADCRLQIEIDCRHPICNRQSAICNWPSFLVVPLQDNTVHDTADFEEFLLVVHHVGAREAGDGVIFP